MSSWLRYRAGASALRGLREFGLTAESVAAVAGPASGPRWLVLAGLDRALLDAGLVGRGGGRRPLLVGASAGAWRMLALASRDPVRVHRALLRGYVNQAFPRGVKPRAVSDAYRKMLGEVFTDDVRHIVSEAPVDVAVHVARGRRFVPWRRRAAHAAAMALAGLAHALSPRGSELAFERVLLHTRPERFRPSFGGSIVRLQPDNLLPAALASGTVPFYMEPVRDIAGAPRGSYLDGGITDYHLRQAYRSDGDGVTLLPHYQKPVKPAWFDRYSKRETTPELLDDVLQIYPTESFVAELPGGRLPDRDDFFRFVDAPDERIRRWNEAAKLGEQLGEELRNDLQSGRLPELVASL